MEKTEETKKIIDEYRHLAEGKNLKLNPDEKILEGLAHGLIENEKKYGARYCPCRRVSGNKEEDEKKICPCGFLEKEIGERGRCLCGLFIK
jgi:ferredoxin-thioredoxin reductase catalytic chain